MKPEADVDASKPRPDIRLLAKESSRQPVNSRPVEPQSEPQTQTDEQEQPPVLSVSWTQMATMIGPIEWAWEGWLPKGFLAILAAESGIGKSLLCLRIAASFMTGAPWPDGTPYTGEKGEVIWAEAEAAQTLNLDRARKWKLSTDGLKTPLPDPFTEFNLNDKRHKANLAELAFKPEIRAIIVDSLSGATQTDENTTLMLRSTKWLAELARNCGKPVLLTHHLNKPNFLDTSDGIKLHRVRGHSSIIQPARVVWALDVPNVDLQDLKRLAVIKNNLGKFPTPLGLSISETGLDFGTAPQPNRKETITDKAADLLLALLEHEPIPAIKIEQESVQAGISRTTLQRAKDKLGINAVRRQGIWYWSLPADEAAKH